jgi:uncharacterized membrane protein YcaP (DUF421 family)
MELLGPVDWRQVFVPATPALETVVRGTVMYLGIFVLLRVFRRRESGTISTGNLLVVVFLADAAQNGMADDYRSVSDGLLLVGTIMVWNLALDWLGYRIPAVQRFVHPPPLPLVSDGRLLRQNMRKELITEDELMSQLREQGVESIAEVKQACMEADGNVSIVKASGETGGRRRTPAG